MFSIIGSDDSPEAWPQTTQEAEIFMSWSQIKNLVSTLGRVVDIIESDIGPIPMSVPKPKEEEASLDRLRGHIGNLGMGRSRPI